MKGKSSKSTFRVFNVIITLFIIISCKESLVEKGTPQYINEIKTWHQQRIENLKKPNGWLNLVGLYWLKEGENTFGSDKSNDIVFPEGKAASHMGMFILNNGEVSLKVNPEINIQSDGKNANEMILYNDLSENTTILTYGSLSWFVIKREDKIGIRLRDYEAELVKNFGGIETYPINEEWRIEAQFIPYNPIKKLTVPSIIGTVSEEDCYGKLVFEKNGETFSLDPMGKDNLFLVFADETNGDETYGGGRFLSVDTPDSTGKTFIDFNKAYNPPCAFTKYATCPMPPKDNYLHLQVTAGEKKYGNH